mmetsp:Transcript_16564/g.36113  ORF Transcript_16564/g.36113 Transcript_16564/m.36113 type:complete len:270 (+) Transcript_16564:254-1063(+)|eukprot:CAMPEP_0168195238 /NCGR_PEP_ID=MMETSP0139_2-20121125/19726_1 /TAXON_ID=44445 /ORGANISM="Pseudo-nitzschia australis, Strain 10249 10 AB" /LENGTH=269 /DNA_ID=CAMNT_0008119033 /DNA_START=191 /DNA_END=1000 /DNA_ORIENTATION=+
MPPALGQEEPLKRITKIVNSLLANEDCAPFREPVDWRELELFDYPQIITNMMDLGTVKRRLERGNYSTTHQVAEDIRLVWRNCMTYNADGSDFWLLAKSYARRFEDRYRKIRQEYDVGECIDGKDKGGNNGGGGGTKSSKSSRSPTSSSNFTTAPPSTGSSNVPAAPPTLDARARFGSNLFFLSGVEMGHIMTTCELECPDALETCGNDRYKIEINVDAIPTDIFANLNTYVTQKVGNANSNNSNNNFLASPGSDAGGNGSRNRKRQRK